MQVKNQYNTLNSENLARNISTLKINNNHKMITYDIKDLCVGIPIEKKLINHETTTTKKQDKHKTKQTVTILQTILEQNCFQFQETIYHPNITDAFMYFTSTIITFLHIL